jgi:hypothetical protein
MARSRAERTAFSSASPEPRDGWGSVDSTQRGEDHRRAVVRVARHQPVGAAAQHPADLKRRIVAAVAPSAQLAGDLGEGVTVLAYPRGSPPGPAQAMRHTAINERVPGSAFGCGWYRGL